MSEIQKPSTIVTPPGGHPAPIAKPGPRPPKPGRRAAGPKPPLSVPREILLPSSKPPRK
jgi:hypothetical protein